MDSNLQKNSYDSKLKMSTKIEECPIERADMYIICYNYTQL